MKPAFAVRRIPVMLAACLVAVASLASAQTDPHVGTWRLNLGQSKFSPGPPPQSVTLTYEADGSNLFLVLEGLDGQGTPMNATKNKIIITFDGKDHATPSLNPDWETASWKRIDANTYETKRKRAGEVVQTVTNVVSQDGRTMTTTTKGKNVMGQTVHDVAVYDKQ
jgi:hypothetical protein